MNKNRTKLTGTDMYRLEVNDFGPIVSASIALRPLTVFIGPSNTGKSYLAILIYALHRFFGGHSPRRYRVMGRGFDPPRWFSRAGTKQTRLQAPLHRSLKNWFSTSSSSGLSALPPVVEAYFRTELERATGPNYLLQEEIRRCYGVECLDDLVRRQSSKTSSSIVLSTSRANGSPGGEYRFNLDRRGGGFSGRVSSIEPLSISTTFTKSFQRNMRQYLATIKDSDEFAVLLPNFLDHIFSDLFQPVLQGAYYLPADRTGVMHSHQVVVSTLVQSATTAGLRPSRDIPMLSGVLADFLSQLIEMSERRFRIRPETELASRLEQAVLDGVVRLKRSATGYPTFAYRPKGWKSDLPLMRASSMVSELAPVVLYLRYVVRPGDVLIIEEPEAHLHPAMQVAFAQELARLVRNGVRIVMTTHSEWFLEQIANLARLSELPEKKRRGIDGADCTLHPDEVGAWLFEQKSRPKGSVVKEIDLSDSGLYQSGFDEVAAVLHNNWAEISSRTGMDQ